MIAGSDADLPSPLGASFLTPVGIYCFRLRANATSERKYWDNHESDRRFRPNHLSIWARGV